MNEKQIPRSFLTHDGCFHADEVVSCALLLLYKLIDRENILRSRAPEKIPLYEYVCDIGEVYSPEEKRFDHHQKSYHGSLSSAGMILKHLFDTKYISEEEYIYFNNEIILGVDAHDNGHPLPEKGYAFFSLIIASYQPLSMHPIEEEELRCFFSAVDFSYDYLLRLKNRFSYIRSFRKEVQRAMQEQTHKSLLYFHRPLLWIENFFALDGENHPAKFVIMPVGNQWKLRCIPPNKEECMSLRQPLPEEWRGKSGKELQSITGIYGAVFCHKGGFISKWETEESAMQAFQLLTEVV